MANTVVGVFDNVRMAEDAAQELIYHGFNNENVDLSSSTEKPMDKKQHKEGISRFFDNLFGDNEESSNYKEVGDRGAVVTVHAQSREEADLASKILDQYGAVDANERASYYRGMPDSDRGIYNEKYSQTDDQNINKSDTLRSDISDTGTVDKDQSMPVIEEDMAVGKREVEGDTVRIRSRIIEKPVEEHLRLRVEKVYVERTPANRLASEADMSTFKEGIIEATEREEVPIINKEARVVEDVKIKKEVEQRDKAVRGTVRKQDVNVERKKKDKLRSPDEEAL